MFTGLTKPTTVRFASDGRAFVAQKNGFVLEYDTLSSAPTTVIDLRTVVDDYWDRGLLGLAIDPGFLTGSNYIYLFLVYDAPPGETAPRWNDACPSPPGATTDGCVVTSELLRVAVDPATNKATGTSVLIHDWCQQFPSHSGGGLAFDASGNLLLSAGDGASFNGPDWGQRGGTLPDTTTPITPANPCGDPPGGVGTANLNTTGEGGMLRAQDVRTGGLPTGDPTGLDGTLIRIDPATGAGVAGNPLASSTDPNDQRIIAHGFRNPFRLTVRPGTDEIYVADVGNQTWEEINRVVPPAGPRTPTTLPNDGWPCYEGPAAASTIGQVNAMCKALYDQAGAVTQPLYAYAHVNTLTPTGPCFAPDVNGKMSSSTTGVAFYEGASGISVDYPSQYLHALFFVDYSRNCLSAILPGAGGVPDPSQMVQIASGISHPVDLVTGPGGDLYYVDLDGGRVMRVAYVKDPVAVATATPPMAHAPVTVRLDGTGSIDPNPGGGIAEYHWDLNHNGTFDEPGIDATGATYDWAITTPAVYPVTLKVVASAGREATTDIVIDATNDPPLPTIDTPSASLTWDVGDTITFTGHATDTEDGPLAITQLRSELLMAHCPADCHLHPIQTWSGVAGGSFVAPDHEYPSHLELRLTATDSHGASTTTSIELMPNSAVLDIASSPAGVSLSMNGNATAGPASLTVMRKGSVTVAAPLVATIGGARYRFDRWSDGLPAVHDVVVAADTSLVATYAPDAPDTCATATVGSTVGSWIGERAGGSGDTDWFRFTLTSTRRVVVTLGDLPVDARLDLYSSCSTLLATVDHAGTRFEELTKLLARGTYRVRVTTHGTSGSPNPYVVRFRPLSAGLPVKTVTVTRTGTTIRIAGEIVNNTGSTRGPVTVTATLRSSTGKSVATLRGVTFARRLGDGSVTSFVIAGTAPAYASISYSATSSAPWSSYSLGASAVSYAPGAGGTVIETGTVRNLGTTIATSVSVARTWYGPRGQILDQRTAALSPSRLAHGAFGSYRLVRPSLPGVQATGTQLRPR